MIQIAVLITCFNRKEKTLKCLEDISLQQIKSPAILDIYIVDGGSSDGTPEAIREKYPQVNVSVCPGLYWAGGMREAWRIASGKKDYDFYWLLNDDTHLYIHCLQELLNADQYALKNFEKRGIYVGSTQDPVKKHFSYGGRKLKKWGNRKMKKIIPDGKQYQLCDLANANIMLVSQDVYQKIGGFCEYYTHGIADYDYTLRASRAGIPIIVCPDFNGECTDDHGKNWVTQPSSLKERIEYLYSPKGLAYRETMYYMREFFPKRYTSAKIKMWLKTLFPFIWNYLK